MRWKWAILLLVCMFGGIDARGQQPGNIKFNHLTREDGLSQSTGQVILQDSQGFMWFGTHDGLNQYNGYEMTVFKHDPEDSVTISGNNISYIYEDSRENLWIGTNSAGLNLYRRDRNVFIHFKADENSPGKSISNNTISSILEDAKGNFWIGTYDGLNYFNPDKQEFRYFYASNSNPGSLSSNIIQSLLRDERGYVWVGTANGLNLWDPVTETFTVFKHDPSDPASISDNDIKTIYQDKQGTLWMGTANGLNSYDRHTGRFRNYLHDPEDGSSISGNSILAILEDNQGVFWVGTENNGLNAFDRETGTFYHYIQDLDDPYSLSNDAVYSLYENDDQILWIGTYAGGINYLDRKQSRFEHYRYDPYDANPLSNNSVTAFLEDSRGNFWVGTDGGGLNLFDRQTKQFHTLRHDPHNDNSLSSNVILALIEDSKGYVWIGYYRGGLSRYDTERGEFTHYRHDPYNPNSLCHDDVFVLIEDSAHNILVGTNKEGMCTLDPETGQVTLYDGEEGAVRDLYEDSSGNIWISYYGEGLKLLDRDKTPVLHIYEGENGLRSNVLLTMYEDKKGNFWVGTKERGLHLFDRDSRTFTNYTIKDGLPSNDIKGILEDDHGTLWISTLNGISAFDPETEDFTNYNTGDGLQGREFNTLAYYKDRQGYMYFGGINGFNRFHPDSIESSAYAYPMVFTDFKIFNKSVPVGEGSPLSRHINYTKQLVLPYTASVLTFEYTALNFNRLKNLRYAYKLDGFESAWNHVGTRRNATYTNLNPGRYVFRVKYINSDGLMNDEGLSLELNITPPFWETSWFYLLSGMFLFGLIAGGYRFRVRQITRQNRVLAQKISERTSELYKKNKALGEALENLRRTRSELVENAHKAGMADIATGVLHNVGNVLNSVNTSTSITREILEFSKLHSFFKANQLLKENLNNVEEFLTENPKGKKLLEYYLKLDELLRKELRTLQEHNHRLEQKIRLINNVIDAQQSYAHIGLSSESISLVKVVEDALTIYSNSFERHHIKVVKQMEDVRLIVNQKTKLVHVLVNILKNAKEAIVELSPQERLITLRAYQDEKNVYLSVSDNGSGIRQEHIKKIFTHGFTTKSDGHGFGLHSCANYMKEMGGKIRVESDGIGKGATFILSFPTGEK